MWSDCSCVHVLICSDCVHVFIWSGCVHLFPSRCLTSWSVCTRRPLRKRRCSPSSGLCSTLTPESSSMFWRWWASAKLYHPPPRYGLSSHWPSPNCPTDQRQPIKTLEADRPPNSGQGGPYILFPPFFPKLYSKNDFKLYVDIHCSEYRMDSFSTISIVKSLNLLIYYMNNEKRNQINIFHCVISLKEFTPSPRYKE